MFRLRGMLMTGHAVDLRLPISGKTAGELELGTVVTVSGTVFTGRSLFHIRAVRDGILPAIDFEKVNCFFHCGPVMEKTGNGWKVISLEPTSSIRFERYSPEVIRSLKARTVIGKTTMGPGTAEALKEVSGVHLTKIGICGNLLARQVKKVSGVYFLEDLGKTEATWVFEVERFGPFFVDMDARGNNYFQKLDVIVRSRMEEITGSPAGSGF